MLTHVVSCRNPKFAPKAKRVRAPKHQHNVLPFSREDLIAVQKLYESLQPKPSAADRDAPISEGEIDPDADEHDYGLVINNSLDLPPLNKDAPTSEEEIDPDADEHDCGLVIDNSSELPPPTIIITESAKIIADNQVHSFRSRIEYEEIENMKDECTPLVPIPSWLDLSQIREFMPLPDPISSSEAMRIDLLSPTGRSFRINRSNGITPYAKLRSLLFALPKELEETHVIIFIELAPDNENHAHAYLKSSELLERDGPALRLAIRYQVDSQDVNATRTTDWLYFQSSGWTENRQNILRRIYKVNALVDFLDGHSSTTTANQPRRWLRSQKRTISGDSTWTEWYTSEDF